MIDDAPRCSIIIPVFGLSDITRKCIFSVLSQTTTFPFEIIVVDDVSPDDTLRMLATFGDRIVVVRRRINGGYSRACNSGLAVARGDYVVFLNNDTHSQHNWLQTLVDYADAHPRAGIIGCRLLFPTQKIQHAGVAFTWDRLPFHIYHKQPMDVPWVSRNRVLQAVTGAVSLVPRQVIERIGGYDEGYLNNLEDIDLCLSVRDMGLEVHYCADAILTHLESETRKHLPDLVSDNAKRFLDRWKSTIRPDALALLEEDGLASGYPDAPRPMRILYDKRIATARPVEPPAP